MTADSQLERLLFVSHDGQLGGAQLALLDSATALAHSGVDVHVVVPHPGGPLAERLTAASVDVRGADVGLWATLAGGSLRERASAVGSVSRSMRELRRLIVELDPQLVVTNTALPAGAAMAAKLTRRPHIWSLHERWEREDPVRFFLGRRLTSATLRRTGHVVVPSEWLATEWRGIAPGRTHLVPPVVSVGGRLPEAVVERRGRATIRRVLFPGGLQLVKRPLDVVVAVAEARATIPKPTLEIFGHGESERALVEQEVARLGMTESVSTRGFVDDAASELTVGSVLVSAGVAETFGRVLVEAMAAGVPVVAARAGASPEVVVDGVTGLLYEPGDASELARCLIRLAEDTELRVRLVRRAHDEAHLRWRQREHVKGVLAAWTDAAGHPVRGARS